MPIYEYKCQNCGEKFELRLSISHDKKSLKCPKCGQADPERIFSPFQTGSSGGGSNCASPSTSGFS
jgi:putative FmdB family regulatory protein